MPNSRRNSDATPVTVLHPSEAEAGDCSSPAPLPISSSLSNFTRIVPITIFPISSRSVPACGRALIIGRMRFETGASDSEQDSFECCSYLQHFDMRFIEQTSSKLSCEQESRTVAARHAEHFFVFCLIQFQLLSQSVAMVSKPTCLIL